MEVTSEVRRVLLSHHVISHRHAKFIENSLKAVNNGLKTGFIWDIGSPVTVSQVKDILDQLKLANVLYEHIILVTIKDEICILNKRLFLEFKIAPLFIDVSEILSEPKILCLNTNEHIMEMINLVTTQIADTSGNILELKVDEENYCIPSVLGILAGYPIVYWYDPIHSKEKQCLTDIDLIVFKVFDENSPILSFSVPKSLSEKEEVQDKINAWKKEMKDFANYRIETSVQHTNNSICLIRRPVEALRYMSLALEICPENLTYMENKTNIINQWIARWHFIMLNDINRNNAYKRAIKNKIKSMNPSNILDIGTGTGLLSIYCYGSNGNSEIYACESDDLMANIAKKVFEINKVPVKLLNQHSTTLDLKELNIEGFDLIVTEIFDSGAFGESVLQTLIHAKKYLLTENGKILPEKINIYVAGVNKIGLTEILLGIESTMENSIYLKNTILVPRVEEPYEVLDQNAYKVELCTEPVLAFSVDLNDLTSLENALNGKLDRQIELNCLDDGILEGFLVYFVLDLDKENKLSNFDLSQTHLINSLNNENSENSTNNSTDENNINLASALNTVSSPKKFKCWDPIKFSLYETFSIRKYQILKINVSCRQGILKLNYNFNVISKRLLEIPIEIFSFLADDEFILELEYNVDKAIKKYSSKEKHVIFGDFLSFPHIGINLLKENKISKLYCSAQVKHLIGKVSSWNCIPKHLINFVDDFENIVFHETNIKFDFILLQPISSCGNLNQSHLKYYQILKNKHLKSHGLIFPAKIDVSCKLIYSEWLDTVTSVHSEELQKLGIENLINEYSTKKQFEFVNFDAIYLSDIFTVSSIQYDEKLYQKEIVVNISSNLQNQYNRINGILYFYKIFFMNNSIPLSTNRKKSFIKSNCFVCCYNITNKNNVKIQYIQDDYIFQCKIVE